LSILKLKKMSRLLVNNDVHIINDNIDITKQLVLILRAYPTDARVAFIKEKTNENN